MFTIFIAQERNSVRRPLILLACLLWSVSLTHQQLTTWSSDVALWSHAASLAPSKSRVLLNAGVALSDAGNWRGACSFLAQAAHSPVHRADEWGETVHIAAILDLASLRTVIACP